MPIANFTVSMEVIVAIKRMAKARRISEPDVWRMVVARGIEGIELSKLSDNLRDEIRKEIGALRDKLKAELLGDMTNVLVENLCLTRRLVGATNIELVRKAQEDAKVILGKLGET